MIQYENHRITSDSGEYVRRISDGLTAKAIAAMTYSADDYEEVDELPVTIDETAYKERVERLIRERYSVADELALLRQREAKPEEFAAYNTFAEQCKAQAKTEVAAEAQAANETNKSISN